MRKRVVLVSFLVLILTVTCAMFAAACSHTEKYTVTWDLDEQVASVEVVDNKYAQTMEFEAETEVSFKVNFKTGYVANSVKAGSRTLRATDGVYKFTVTENMTVSVTSRELLENITVALVDENKVFYAGDVVTAEDIVVTGHYATGRTDTLVGTITYQTVDGDKLALGDTKFSVSYPGVDTVDVELGYAVKGLVTLDLGKGYFTAEEAAKLPQGFVKVNDSLYTYEFAEPLAADIVLPEPTMLLDESEPDSALPFERWSGLTDGKLVKGLNTRVDATAVYTTELVNVSEMKFVEKDGIPYLVITGEFKAAKSAYLYLFEGNNPPVEYGVNTPAVSTDGKAFILELDLAAFITATPIDPETKEEMPKPNDSFVGKWMDIRFCVRLGSGYVVQQELFVSSDMTYADLGDEIVSKVTVGEGEEAEEKFYRFFYESWTPAAGDAITGVPGATFTGTEKILKLHVEETDPYQITEVTLANRENVAYLIINGNYFNTKAEAEEMLTGYIADMQNFTTWANVNIEGKQKLTLNDDSTFEIALALDGITEDGMYIMHLGGGANFDPSNYDKNVEITIGSRTYSLGEADLHGWGWAWTYVKMVDATYAANKSVIVENDVPYFILMGDAGERTADEVKAALTQFDFENEADSSNKTVIAPEKITVTVENGIYTVKVDISELPVGKYWVHAVGLIDGNGDVHPDASKPAVTVNGKIYQGIDDQKDWGIAHLLQVKDANAPEVTVNGVVSLEEGENTVYLVITGSYKNYASAEALKADLVVDGQNANDWLYTDLTSTEITVDEEQGTYTLKVDLSEVAAGQYLVHVNGGDVGNESGIAAIEVGGRTYSYEFRDFGGWTRYVLTIVAA